MEVLNDEQRRGLTTLAHDVVAQQADESSLFGCCVEGIESGIVAVVAATYDVAEFGERPEWCQVVLLADGEKDLSAVPAHREREFRDESRFTDAGLTGDQRRAGSKSDDVRPDSDELVEFGLSPDELTGKPGASQLRWDLVGLVLERIVVSGNVIGGGIGREVSGWCITGGSHVGDSGDGPIVVESGGGDAVQLHCPRHAAQLVLADTHKLSLWMVAHHIGRRSRHDDVATLRDGQEPSRAVDRRPEVVAGTFLGLTRVQRHPDVQGQRRRPQLLEQQALGVDSRIKGCSCPLEGGSDTVPAPRKDEPIVSLHDGLQDLVVTSENVRHQRRMHFPELSGFHDVGE